jgi:hypothetical protein
MAGFLGSSTPVYDISKHYLAGDTRDLLIRNLTLGSSLAACFDNGGMKSTSSQQQEDCGVVLMRGHGFTVVASSIEQCIFRAIYTKENAIVQTASLGLSMAYHGTDKGAAKIEYLRADEIGGATAISQTAWSRAWRLWVREVEASDMYVSGP